MWLIRPILEGLIVIFMIGFGLLLLWVVNHTYCSKCDGRLNTYFVTKGSVPQWYCKTHGWVCDGD
jgi:hypothetical protein